MEKVRFFRFVYTKSGLSSQNISKSATMPILNHICFRNVTKFAFQKVQEILGPSSTFCENCGKLMLRYIFRIIKVLTFNAWIFSRVSQQQANCNIYQVVVIIFGINHTPSTMIARIFKLSDGHNMPNFQVFDSKNGQNWKNDLHFWYFLNLGKISHSYHIFAT